MFWKDLENWDKKKYKTYKIICELVYFFLMVVAPTIIICCKYDVFTTVSTHKKLTAVGWIMVIVLGIYAYMKIRQVIKKLPDIEYKERVFKFTLEMIFTALPFILFMVAIVLVRDDLNLAFNTMLWCLISFTAAAIWDGLTLKYFVAEETLRNAAKTQKAVDKRKNVV